MDKQWEERADATPFVWLSVSPRWAELIASGKKTVEWRKSAPSIPAGTPFLLYSSAPQKELVGAGRLSGVSKGPWRELAERLGDRGAASAEELRSYFEGGGVERSARALEIESFAPFEKAMPWARLKHLAPWFSPPVAPQRIEGDRALELSQAALALSWSSRAPEIELMWLGEEGLDEGLKAYFEAKGMQLESSYPGAQAWMKKAMSEMESDPKGDRGMVVARAPGGQVAGFAVIKKSESKIASLRVEEGFRSADGGAGLGMKMFGACCERLGSARPYWTAAAEIWPQLSGLAERMGWSARSGPEGWVVGREPTALTPKAPGLK